MVPSFSFHHRNMFCLGPVCCLCTEALEVTVSWSRLDSWKRLVVVLRLSPKIRLFDVGVDG